MMKIAIAQLNPTIGDLTGNAQQILAAAQQAASENVRLLLTPELSLCGYPPRDLLMQPMFIQAMATTLNHLTDALPAGVAVLVGTVVHNERSPQTGGKPLFNSTALLDGGAIRQVFHKRLLPTYDVFDEARYFEPGLESTFFELDGVQIGVTICEDLWNDEEFWGKRNYTVNPIADLTSKGVDFIVNLSASPYTVGKQLLRESMLMHSATRFNTPILYVNQVGGNDDLLFDGNSFGFNRDGSIIFRAKAFEADLITLEYTTETQTSGKSEGSLRAISPHAVASAFRDQNAEIWQALVTGVRDYVRKCGFQKIVLGLSGGIDSSLVAAIATAAVGRENVLGVLMPSPYSSSHSVTDALALAKNLGIETQILPIGDLMKEYDQLLADLFAHTEFGIAEENLQSRIRGNLLMAISNKFGHLLLSTGNKSEMAVGYCTLYGDMNGGLAAIADVPKTRVYQLCEWLNRGGWQSHWGDTSLPMEVIPAHVITKPPSAELKPGQVDQDSLPPYEILDDILERYIEQHESPDAIVAAGYDAITVDKVIRLVTRAEFKRKQAPPGLKITDRAFGTGWRVPIASKWLPHTQA